jgi:hypothetical protein
MTTMTTILAQPLGAFLPSLLTGLLLLGMNQPSYAADLSGTWTGHWESHSSGHKGPLKAAFCKLDDTHYQVRFSGRFLKIIPFRYTVTLEATGQEKDKTILTGEHHLRFFGTFHYRAEATDCEFTANYCADKDSGVFVLTHGSH